MPFVPDLTLESATCFTNLKIRDLFGLVVRYWARHLSLFNSLFDHLFELLVYTRGCHEIQHCAPYSRGRRVRPGRLPEQGLTDAGLQWEPSAYECALDDQQPLHDRIGVLQGGILLTSKSFSSGAPGSNRFLSSSSSILS